MIDEEHSDHPTETADESDERQREPSAPVSPSRDSDIPESERPGMTLPKTIYVWLLLLLFAFAAPAVIPQESRKVRAGGDTTLSATEFSDLVQGETKARAAFGIDATQRQLGALAGLGRSPAASAGGKRADQRGTLLADAAQTFRKMEQSQPGAGLVRRILVIEHAQGKPLDETLLTKDLPAALAKDEAQPSRVAEEQRLWRGIYGKPPSVAKGDVPGFERLIAGLNLRFLKDRVLADLYGASGDRAKAKTFQDAFDRAMMKSSAAQALLGFYLGCIALTGLACFIVFAVAARTGNWPLIRRTATAPQILGWGDLLDAFVFYLAVVKALGLAASLLAVRFLPDPSPHDALGLQSGIYVGTGFLALTYLLNRAGLRGANLADIGLRTPNGVLAEMGYGFLGYCAGLPLMLSLAALSHLLFQHDQTRTPNPILPLIAIENDPLSRLVIFLLVSVAAPFFEELFFRGVLFSGLRTRYGWIASAALTSVVFAVVHPMQDWLPIFGLGFALATMREMRQSLIPGMTAHFLQNTLSFVSMSVLFGYAP